MGPTRSRFVQGRARQDGGGLVRGGLRAGLRGGPDSLKFTHAGGYRYRIADFTTNDVELFDITDAAGVQRVLNGTYSGSGPYTLEVEPAGATGPELPGGGIGCVEEPRRGGQGPRLEPCRRRKCGGLDHDHPPQPGLGRLRRSAGLGEQFVSLRQSQGLRTAVVDIEDSSMSSATGL